MTCKLVRLVCFDLIPKLAIKFSYASYHTMLAIVISYNVGTAITPLVEDCQTIVKPLFSPKFPNPCPILELSLKVCSPEVRGQDSRSLCEVTVVFTTTVIGCCLGTSSFMLLSTSDLFNATITIMRVG